MKNIFKPTPRTSKNNKADYKVVFVSLRSKDGVFFRLWTIVLSYGALLFAICLAVILFHPDHWVALKSTDSTLRAASTIMLVCLALLQLFLILGTYSATRSTIKARDPKHKQAIKNLRVAFATTRAPGEPVDMVERTLRAATRVRYKKGTVDIWLLDETNDQVLMEICKSLGVKYFSRNGIDRWNTIAIKNNKLRRFARNTLSVLSLGLIRRQSAPVPTDKFFAAKSKHGNFNAWRDYLKTSGETYDILAGVDTDQVPKPFYLERILGYFKDKDVAFVVGPQVYGNYGPGIKNLVARWSESQASFFQSTIQRAGNATNSPMFVGTNYAVRMDVLDQINGFQPCITEDMATGLAIHSKRNPLTGKRWKSVYVPDVLAIGEGPDYWAPYFTQQWRWAAGAFDTWKRMVWRVFFRLSPGARLHYFLILTYFPMTAITWLLGIVSSMLYLATGATAILAPWNMFVSLYLMFIVLQLSLYFWNRRFNVSPHEPIGSYGVAGMAISTIAAPIYFSALIGVILGKKAHFVVTTKGKTDSPDWFPTFKTHLQWFVVLSAGLIYGFMNGHTHPAMLIWTFVQILICLSPIVLGMYVSVMESVRVGIGKKSLIFARGASND